MRNFAVPIADVSFQRRMAKPLRRSTTFLSKKVLKATCKMTVLHTENMKKLMPIYSLILVLSTWRKCDWEVAKEIKSFQIEPSETDIEMDWVDLAR